MEQRAMTKQELAILCGVSRNTMGRWLKLIEPQLKPLGYHRQMRLLPPKIVVHIFDLLCL